MVCSMWNMFVSFLVLVFTTVCWSCPNNWIGHETSCYHFSHDMETWADASAICKMFGAYLVEVNSDLENNFIQNNLKYVSSWLGLTDLLEEGVWIWMSSFEPLTYTHWQSGEPNNFGGNENCGYLYNASKHVGWYDRACSLKDHYVCEQEASSEVIVG